MDGTLEWNFSGGFLDLMGVMFTLDNGSFVDLWSFGLSILRRVHLDRL
ncbi:MAG: hypothetical protein ACREPH_04335 [Rhodanobacteraceae bacterium]